MVTHGKGPSGKTGKNRKKVFCTLLFFCIAGLALFAKADSLSNGEAYFQEREGAILDAEKATAFFGGDVDQGVLQLRDNLGEFYEGATGTPEGAVMAFGDCAEYARLGIPGNDGVLLCRKGYLLAHDAEFKTPIWVAERLTKSKAQGTIARKDSFRADLALPVGERAELSDYKNSGYDRGHMAPAANMKFDLIAMEESFLLSNMVPQVGRKMNQGIWAILEEQVRQWAIDREEVFIYTGPIYNNDRASRTIGDNYVGVPDKFYKIVYDPNVREAIAFVMPNAPLETRDMPLYIVSIRDIEMETGLNFLSTLHRKEQNRIEKSKAEMPWKVKK